MISNNVEITVHTVKYKFEMTGSAFMQMMTMIGILRDIKQILNLNLYDEHMHEERIKEAKIDLDLSARSTYT